MNNLYNPRWRDITILITGATGSLGRALVRYLLADCRYKDPRRDIRSIRCFARDPHKLMSLLHDFPQSDSNGQKKIRTLIGDVRDRERMLRATENVKVVIHTAALKHIELGQSDPWEFVATNIIGTQSVIDACRKNKVSVAAFCGTDKGVNPSSVYGSTKLVAEQCWILANTGKHKTKFVGCRYGNVLASRGSVLEIWEKQHHSGLPLTITNPNMLRFYITIEAAARLVWNAVLTANAGEIFIPKLKSISTLDLARIIYPNDILDIKNESRPGEKISELLIGPEEMMYTRDMGTHFIRYPNVGSDIMSTKMVGAILEEGMVYSSATCERLNNNEITEMLNGKQITSIASICCYE